MRSRAIILGIGIVLALVAGACSGAAPTPTPTPLPTPTPRPTATATPAGPASGAMSMQPQSMMAMLPPGAQSALYIDVAAIRADPRLKGAVDSVMAAYLGTLATVASSVDQVSAVAISMNPPMQLTVAGNFNGALIAGLMGMSGYPAGTYKNAPFVQINKTPTAGAPNFVAFPAQGVAALGADQKAMEQMVDLITDKGAPNAMGRADMQRTVSQLGPSTLMATGTGADLQALMPGVKTLKVTFGGLSILATGDGNLGATAFLLFATESDAQAAEQALANPAAQAALLSVPGGSQVSNVSVARSGREVIVKAEAPISVLDGLMKAQVKP